MKKTEPMPGDLVQARLTLAAVSLAFGIADMTDCESKRQDPAHCFARQVAMYLLHTNFHITQTRAAQIFARHYSTVSHACKVIEASRDDPVFDNKLLSLERFLRQAPIAQTALDEAA